jgi:hypothetical protein
MASMKGCRHGRGRKRVVKAGRSTAIQTTRVANALAMWCFTFVITGLFVRYLSRHSALRRYLCDASYFPHEADVTWARRGVGFQGESGHDADWLSLPSLTPKRTRGHFSRGCSCLDPAKMSVAIPILAVTMLSQN